jgi:pyruvate formate lyase activating enzyme
MLWERAGDSKVKCNLCARRCKIPNWKRGFCRVRENREGKLYTLNYGAASSVASDPIEKKPLFHFHPGTSVFSLGTVSCNFRCQHCQNFTISQTTDTEYLTTYEPERAVEDAIRQGCRGIAWTYNEPTIWFEYTYDSAKLAKEKGLYTVYVTNGYFTHEMLDKISPYLDAANIDVKGFTEVFYKNVSKAELSPVLKSVERAVSKGMHIEITYLVIPTKNDSEDEIRDFVDWIARLDKNIPVHFTRFHPDYKMLDLYPTPIETLEKARKIALEKIRYAYVGNVPGHEGENTYCYECGELIIRRWGFGIDKINMVGDCCPRCGAKIHVIK